MIGGRGEVAMLSHPTHLGAPASGELHQIGLIFSSLLIPLHQMGLAFSPPLISLPLWLNRLSYHASLIVYSCPCIYVLVYALGFIMRLLANKNKRKNRKGTVVIVAVVVKSISRVGLVIELQFHQL
jgi:hypothetical protein